MLLPDRTPDWLRSLIANAVGFVMMTVMMTVLWYLLGRPFARWAYGLSPAGQWWALGLFIAACLLTIVGARIYENRRRY